MKNLEKEKTRLPNLFWHVKTGRAFRRLCYWPSSRLLRGHFSGSVMGYAAPASRPKKAGASKKTLTAKNSDEASRKNAGSGKADSAFGLHRERLGYSVLLALE